MDKRISVEERLPGSPAPVVAYNEEYDDEAEGQYDGKDWYFLGSDVKMCGVTHWKPKPPEEAEEAKEEKHGD